MDTDYASAHLCIVINNMIVRRMYGALRGCCDIYPRRLTLILPADNLLTTQDAPKADMFRTDQFSKERKRQDHRREIGLSDPSAGPAPALDAAGSPETRLYQRVAQRIRAFIGRQRLAPGQRLPSERDLATTLGVSRTSLREALIALELGGVIEVRAGAGAYVHTEPDRNEACVPEADAGPFECLSARRLIEPELAAMAARMASDAAIAAIREAAAEMEKQQADRIGAEQADRNFHRAIARATGNSALVSVLDCLWNLRGSLWHTLEEHFQTEELKKETLADHRRIVQAIAARDPAEARHAMRAHLERVTRTLSSG
jgi:DNA-binding FadR family transcriptional regulator